MRRPVRERGQRAPLRALVALGGLFAFAVAACTFPDLSIGAVRGTDDAGVEEVDGGDGADASAAFADADVSDVGLVTDAGACGFYGGSSDASDDASASYPPFDEPTCASCIAASCCELAAECFDRTPACRTQAMCIYACERGDASVSCAARCANGDASVAYDAFASCARSRCASCAL